jgi:hypothetical protein
VADEIILEYFIQLSMPILSGSHPARSTAGGYLWIHYPSGWALLLFINDSTHNPNGFSFSGGQIQVWYFPLPPCL